MSDSFWTQVYDPQGMRAQGHTPNRYLFCLECKGLGGHAYTCPKVTKEELAALVTRAQKHEKWAREKAEKMLNAVQRTYGKLAMIKHENNKLRRANERLRAEVKQLQAAAPTLAADSPFEKIILGTTKLHLLGLAGQNDSNEADAIRDELDGPWRELTERQRQVAREISAAIAKACAATNHDASPAATARVDAAGISRQGASDTSPLAAGARAENGEGGSGNRQPLHSSPASAVTDDRPAPTAATLTDAERAFLRRLQPSEYPFASYSTVISPEDRKTVFGLLARLGGGE